MRARGDRRGDASSGRCSGKSSPPRPRSARFRGRRACVRSPEGGKLGVIDYAQIEARALMWIADDGVPLERFHAGVDPYRAMAGRIYGLPPENGDAAKRTLGKALVLGCG